MMRSSSISLATNCVLVVGMTASLAAQPGPCQQVTAACQSAGFVQGGLSTGNGLQKHCVIPLMQGIAQPADARIPLPSVDPQVVASCKKANPSFGQAALTATNSTAPATSGSNLGGAVYNTPAANGSGQGGAIYNAPGASGSVQGGAIYNAPGASGSGQGGAVYANSGVPGVSNPGVEIGVPAATGVLRAPASNGPIVVNWKFKHDLGLANLIVNPDGTYLFSGHYNHQVQNKALNIILALKSDLGGEIVFRYTGDVSNGPVQWSKEGKDAILKDNFKTFAGPHDWQGTYTFPLDAEAKKEQKEQTAYEKHACKHDAENGVLGYIPGATKFCQQFNAAW
jgi:hypothetical protein